ncbi:RpiB/LacA/LacB family sugar-phosphate isomerase [Bacillus sp. AGMB 02131]|uniref:RpiB/LacA/LacB family sugar-phosphate isomerase n=1 Tax=Peribacillus faecalis TaxID=2772559 RepID=A0A927CYU4_9BACI|nr:RpiB/LacA/LacB family sugar-phosphate isomerase [Peribacillus faecalis]MBD3109526.1 RpiB/LacA/LacB family sugar-phosphate isomerase [Peribacillus faecalis]
MKIAMASDHAGYELKEEVKHILEQAGHEVIDFGAHSTEAADLSDSVYPASLAVANGEAERGIFIDGVGYGSALIANKIYGVTAVVCQDPFCARLAREHTDSNVLCLGGKIIGSAMVHEIVDVWMKTDFFKGIEKYERRVQKVNEIVEKHVKKLSEI